MKEILYKLKAMDEISGQLYFTIQLIEAESDTRSPEIKILKSKESGFRWKVLGFNFLPAKEWKKGIRSISVDPLQPDARISTGDILIGETSLPQ